MAEDLGSVDEYYAFTDEGVSYELFKSTGSNGYKNGTVTMWILIKYEDGEAVSVEKAVLDSYEKQTLMSSFGEEFFDRYTSLTKDQLKDGVLFKTGKPNIDNNAFSTATTFSTPYPARRDLPTPRTTPSTSFCSTYGGI